MPGRLHDADYSVFVECLIASRKRVGMTQTELSRRLDRPQSYVSKIERLERRLDVGEWRSMIRALGEDPAVAFSEASVLIDQIALLADAPPSR